MSDDRPVHTDALKTLGFTIGPEEKRDAIHLAVEPVTAGEALVPGEHIGLLPDGTASSDAETVKYVGIVDPFLSGIVPKGERFWLILYPRQITSLRHVWEHPDFVPSDETRPKGPVMSDSEKWMRAWAVKHMGEDYYGEEGGCRKSETAAFAFAIESGHTRHIGPYEDARDYIDNEWWAHWESITGVKRPDDPDDAYFSCSC